MAVATPSLRSVQLPLPRPIQFHAPAPCAIVLAGGRGARMQPVIRQWLGTDIPKQYCTFVGTRSMLQHTLDRAQCLVAPRDCMTIIAKDDYGRYARSVSPAFQGPVITQPEDRGTAAGILLPATYLMDQSPLSTVIILPSDHFIYPERRFAALLAQACELADRHFDRLILLGAEATRPEPDYGWIRLGKRLPGEPALYDVAGFREKPALEDAQQLMEEYAVWNTFIMVAKVRTLMTLACRYVPETAGRFEIIRGVRRAVRDGRATEAHEAAALAKMYETLPVADFSRDVLQRAMNRCAVLPMQGIHWCDWGRPERVQETLENLGKAPHFAAHLAQF